MHGYVLMQKVAEMGRGGGQSLGRRGLGGKEPLPTCLLLCLGAGRAPNPEPGPLASAEGASNEGRNTMNQLVMRSQRPDPRSLQGGFREILLTQGRSL